MSNFILVVDDDHLVRMQIRGLLEPEGYEVGEAGSGQEALSVYTQFQPSMVLLDVTMPGMDGVTCCQRLRNLPSGENIPILIITEFNDSASVERGFAAGATDYISKPIQGFVLRQRVRRLIEANCAIEELRQQTEQAQTQEVQLRMALSAAHMGTWEWDIITQKVTWSDNKEAMFGLEKGSFDGTYEAFINCIHPEDRQFVSHSIRQTVDGAGEYDIEFRAVMPDGSIRWMVSKGKVFRNSAGVAVKMSGVDIDITNRKQAELALRESEERWQLALRGNNDGIWDWNVKTNEVFFSTRWKEMLGYEEHEITNHIDEWAKRTHPDDIGWVMEVIQDHFDKKTPFYISEHRVLCKDGSYKWILDRGQALWDENGNVIRMTGSHTDITERKLAEEELQRQHLRSQLFANVTLKIRQSLQIDEILQTSVTEVQKLLQADRVVIVRLRPDGVIAVAESVVSGFPVVMGKHIIDKCFDSNYMQIYGQGRIRAINDIYQANIEPCHVELLERFAVKANLAVPIMRQNKLWGLLIAHQCAHPRQWNEWEIELLQQLADQVGVALTQAKLLEQETQQRQELARSNQELQQFAFVASHDLQEPLRKIKTFGDRLKATCGDALTPQGRDYLERMQNAASRMQILIEDLLSLSRVTSRGEPFVPVNLTQIAQEVISDLEIRIQQTGGTVEVEDLPTIVADPLQMRQLLQNLIGNALKFHRPETPPIIKIYSQDYQSQSNQLLSSEYFQLIIEDNGIGFEEKYLERIFNVFQRLHGRSQYEGTGIGLAICKKIVERHCGSITATSQLGQGSNFIITLPIHLY
ncbi:MAG: PAS domain-containing protein [Calothrix sp. MO_167.B42]|nr:PAS domain-containing protein [Calothrix sp. MO_167.B42]